MSTQEFTPTIRYNNLWAGRVKKPRRGSLKTEFTTKFFGTPTGWECEIITVDGETYVGHGNLESTALNQARKRMQAHEGGES